MCACVCVWARSSWVATVLGFCVHPTIGSPRHTASLVKSSRFTCGLLLLLLLVAVVLFGCLRVVYFQTWPNIDRRLAGYCNCRSEKRSKIKASTKSCRTNCGFWQFKLGHALSEENTDAPWLPWCFFAAGPPKGWCPWPQNAGSALLHYHIPNFPLARAVNQTQIQADSGFNYTSQWLKKTDKCQLCKKKEFKESMAISYATFVVRKHSKSIAHNKWPDIQTFQNMLEDTDIKTEPVPRSLVHKWCTLVCMST